MPPEDTTWDTRAARARLLATTHPEAAQILEFYAALAAFQRHLVERLGHAFVPPDTPRGGPADSPRSIVETVGRDRVHEAIARLLRWLRGRAPALLAEDVTRLEQFQPAEWARLAEAHWAARGLAATDGDEQTRFVLEAALQPFSEAAHREAGREIGSSRHATCPACGGHPICGALREESQGARRTLVCGLCSGEWAYLRMVCPACFEQRFEALGVYTAPEFPHLRLDICHTCGTYLKTVDLTKDGRAVPLVDDLASIALDLWARDRGHHKIRPNLLRL